MDEVARGYIESVIDDLLKYDVVPNVEWLGGEATIKSLSDLALGYMVGGVQAFAVSMLSVTSLYKGSRGVSEEDRTEVRAIIKRRIPEFVQKITKEMYK